MIKRCPQRYIPILKRKLLKFFAFFMFLISRFIRSCRVHILILSALLGSLLNHSNVMPASNSRKRRFTNLYILINFFLSCWSVGNLQDSYAIRFILAIFIETADPWRRCSSAQTISAILISFINLPKNQYQSQSGFIKGGGTGIHMTFPLVIKTYLRVIFAFDCQYPCLEPRCQLISIQAFSFSLRRRL